MTVVAHLRSLAEDFYEANFEGMAHHIRLIRRYGDEVKLESPAELRDIYRRLVKALYLPALNAEALLLRAAVHEENEDPDTVPEVLERVLCLRDEIIEALRDLRDEVPAGALPTGPLEPNQIAQTEPPPRLLEAGRLDTD